MAEHEKSGGGGGSPASGWQVIGAVIVLIALFVYLFVYNKPTKGNIFQIPRPSGTPSQTVVY